MDKTLTAGPNGSSSMRTLQAVTAVIELGAGLALLSIPSTTAILLIGVPLEVPAALTIARVAGVALLALGVACWLSRRDTHSRAARGLIAAMVLYNFGVVLILGSAGILSHSSGIALWPAVALHALMTPRLVRHLPSEWEVGKGKSRLSTDPVIPNFCPGR